VDGPCFENGQTCESARFYYEEKGLPFHKCVWRKVAFCHGVRFGTSEEFRSQCEVSVARCKESRDFWRGQHSMGKKAETSECVAVQRPIGAADMPH